MMQRDNNMVLEAEYGSRHRMDMKWSVKQDDIAKHKHEMEMIRQITPPPIPPGIQNYYNNLLGLNNKENHMDVTEEMKDLLQVYTDSLEILDTRTADSLHNLVGYMKRFIEVFDERTKTTQKMERLKLKMGIDDEEDDE